MRPDDRDWAQQPGESARAFAAFEAYMNLGPEATLKLAAKAAGAKLRSVEYWSVRFVWAKRKNSHDRFLSEQSRRKGDAQIISARARHAAQDHAYGQVLIAPAVELSKRIAEGKFDIATLSNKELVELTIRAASVAPRIQMAERLAMGDTEGYRPVEPDAPPDTLTVIVEEDAEARKLAATLIQRVGQVEQQRLEEEVAELAVRRKKAEGTAPNTDWNGSRPSINHEHFDPTTPSMLKEDAPASATPAVVEPEPEPAGPTLEEQKAERARAAKAREK